MLDSRSSDERAERIEKVVGHLRKRLAPEEAEGAEEFVRIFYANVGLDDLRQETTENLYGAALSMWRFSARRQPGEARIRVFNPKVEESGWASPHTIVEIANDDMPFLVDSVTGYLNQRGYPVHLVIHPIVRVERDAEGLRHQLLPRGRRSRGSVRESLMQVQIGEQSEPAVQQAIAEGLHDVLRDVRLAVDDWRQMLERLEQTVAELAAAPGDDVEETRNFLTWMREDHFTFLGCRDYSYRRRGDDGEVAVVPESGLGILRDEERHVLTPPSANAEQDLAPIARQFVARPETLLITKTSVRGTVHRPVHMDYVSVKRFAPDGSVIGERRFVGLFTASAYNRTPRDIPLLRRKVAQVVERAGLEPDSHDGKALLHILETYPRDELFQIDLDTLSRISHGILEIQERPHIRLFVRRDPFDRYFSVLIFVPRERLATDLRKTFESILLRALNGRVSNYYTQVSDSPLARIHYIIGINPPGPPAEIDFALLEQRLIEAARSWQDELHDKLVGRWGEERGTRLAQHYAQAFPPSYTESFNAELALHDIEHMERLAEGADAALDFYRLIEDPVNAVRFKIFNVETAVPLSDCLPMLEHMGLKVIGETPHLLKLDGRADVWIHDFYMEDPQGREIDLGRLKGLFEEAFGEVWRGAVESDGFNRLVLGAGLSWREVVVLRAYCKYLRQTGIAFSQDYMEATLAHNPEIARSLVALFRCRFDPDEEGDREASAAARVQEVTAGLEAVSSLDEDRILRRFLNLVQSSLRTNYFQPGADGGPKPYLSIKFDSQKVAGLPLPRPFREIFVYSPRVEAVHLRGGKVARGGLRWSDRREDFRTEVLGLMKAQMVKNAVIVPVGSKGGFVCKRLPAGDRAAVMAEVVECYKTFIRGLLDITDNLAGQDVVVPPQVLRYDDDDPYLVVAADKGTATFSDIANGVAIDYGFWLGDAFASGGAQGYDHKGMGITARGAWESVKRHFRELGRDIQVEPF
ncbi:MAG TPA: NAD-glutamate dehydrogenase domain-containing protein, partial [Alphaproteobacteria bacterium]|nr:NAD-glutamate dehydrogenase domain-containing protein [Alphaproteobacteria bacterium]